MPDAKNNAKLTGDTHLPDLDDLQDENPQAEGEDEERAGKDDEQAGERKGQKAQDAKGGKAKP